MTRALLPEPLAVLAAVAAELDTEEFRPLNERYWALKIGVVQQTISTALHTAVGYGALEAGPPDGTTHMYRLCPEHPDVVALAAVQQPQTNPPMER